MLAQFANKSLKKSKKSSLSIPKTTEFVRAVSDQDLRLSYGALSTVALVLGEVQESGQSLGQRGIGLVKALPPELQPMVCRGGSPSGETFGTYHRKAIAAWTVELREDLMELPVIGKDVVGEAVGTWIESLDDQSSSE